MWARTSCAVVSGNNEFECFRAALNQVDEHRVGENKMGSSLWGKLVVLETQGALFLFIFPTDTASHQKAATLLTTSNMLQISL